MNTCFITKLKGVVNNDSLLKLGEIKFQCNALNTVETSIFYSSSNSFDASSKEIDVGIISNEGVTFTDGSTSFKSTPKNKVYKKIKTDKTFVLSVKPKYNLTSVVLKKQPTSSYIAVDANFNINELNWCKSLKTLTIYDEYKGSLETLLSTLTSLVNLNIYADMEFNLSKINLARFKSLIINSKKVSGTIAQFKNLSLSDMKDWAQVINNSSISGDLADIPSTVCYLNMPYSAVSWTKGKRQTGNIMALNISSNNIGFISHEDVDNMFIDQALCTFSGDTLPDKHGTSVYKIVVKCPNGYTPSIDAQRAIASLYKKGLTNIIVNNVEMDNYK